jgi:hypothetical protein
VLTAQWAALAILPYYGSISLEGRVSS